MEPELSITKIASRGLALGHGPAAKWAAPEPPFAGQLLLDELSSPPKEAHHVVTNVPNERVDFFFAGFAAGAGSGGTSRTPESYLRGEG